MSAINVYRLCPKCHGTGNRAGVIPDGQGGYIETDECVGCESTGFIPIGKVDSDAELTQKVNELQTDMTKALKRLKKIMQKLDCWEED